MPPPPRGGQGGSQREPRFPRCAFLGYFLCTSKESNKNLLTRPRCGRMGISKQKLLSSPTDSRAQRALVKEFMFISLRLAKKRTKETSRRHLRFLRLFPWPPRGGGIGGAVALFRHHLACIRRSSVRSSLERLFEVLVVHRLIPFLSDRAVRVPPTIACNGGVKIK